MGEPERHTGAPHLDGSEILVKAQIPVKTVTAAIRFPRYGGDVAIITLPRRGDAALAGTHGTRVVARRAEARTAAGA